MIRSPSLNTSIATASSNLSPQIPWSTADTVIYRILDMNLNMSSLKESYMAQNSLELKPPSRSSPPFYAKQRTLSLSLSFCSKEKVDIKVDYTQLPAGPASGLSPKCLAPCEQPWRRTGPLKTVTFHIHAYIYLLFSWISVAAC